MNPLDGPGFVYVARLRFRGDSYKVGAATNPAVRLGQLSLPGPILLLHTIPSDRMGLAEGVLHERLKARRLRGEWFDLDPAHLVDLLSIARISFDGPGGVALTFDRMPALSYVHELTLSGLEPNERAALLERLGPPV